MKTERRHELQHNELVQLLMHYHAAVRPYLGWVASAVAFLAVIWLALSWLGASRERQLQAGWSEFVRAANSGDIEGLRQVAEQFPRGPAAARALFTAGKLGLHSGTGQLLFDRADGLEQLEQARKDLEAALSSPYQDSYLAPQAILALAQVFEGLNQLDKAKEQYQRVLDNYPDSGFALTAKQRLEFVNMADAAAFSDWFAKQHIERPTSASTSGWTPPKSSINDDLPVSRDLLLPDADALEQGGSIYESELDLTPPMEGEQAPSSEPSSTPPDDPTPESSETPADDAGSPPTPDESSTETDSSNPSSDDDPSAD